MQRVKQGSANRFTLFQRATGTHYLLVFTNSVTDGDARCVVAPSATDPIVLNFTETDSPVALSGQVSLVPLGEWSVSVYAQNSSANLTPASSLGMVWSSEVYVEGDAAGQGSWTPNYCEPATITNSDVSYTVDVAAGSTFALPDITHTDSDGVDVTLPAMTPFVATVCSVTTSGLTRRRAIAIGRR